MGRKICKNRCQNGGIAHRGDIIYSHYYAYTVIGASNESDIEISYSSAYGHVQVFHCRLKVNSDTNVFFFDKACKRPVMGVAK